MKRYILLALALIAGAAQAEQTTVGIHGFTYHSSNIECDNGKNPGMYVSDGETGITAGFYRNSCKRQSEYIGWNSPDIYGLSVMFMAVTGYVNAITPMVTPTLAVDVAKDTSVRITGGSWQGMDVYHLSVEKRF